MYQIRKQKKCLACGAELSAPLFEIANMPFGAQSMPSAEELENDRGIDLGLCRCPVCGLVQFDCEPVPYYREAIRVVGLSETMRELRRADYRLLIGKYGMGGKKWLECGCGNGDFLRVLTEFDAEIYGTEWGESELAECRWKLCGVSESSGEANKLCGVSESSGEVNTLCGGGSHQEENRGEKSHAAKVSPSHLMHFFPERTDMPIEGAPFDVFLSFNFLEHQPDPRSMLCCLRNNLREGGIGLITVPSFEYIIGEGRYYELVRDHIANYDLDSLSALCTGCGFEILEKGFLGIGDTLRVVVRKPEQGQTVSKAPAIAASRCGNEDDGSALDANPCHDQTGGGAGGDRIADADRSEPVCDIGVLAGDYRRMRGLVAEYMERLRAQGRSAALWGAGHQGFTIAATTEMKDHIRYIIDSSEKKQGRFAPASHLKIVPPEEYLIHPVDVIIISAPGYVREIEKSIRERYRDTAPGVPAICSILDFTER